MMTHLMRARLSFRLIVRFSKEERASVSAISAFYICAALLVAAFALDLSILYVAKQRDQVVADVANIAAASTASAITDATVSATAVATAKNLVEINGLGAATTTTTAVSSPRGDGTTVLLTTIDRDVDLGLGLLSNKAALPVSVSSWASSEDSADCITSLLAPVNIYGASVVKGDYCRISAKTYLYVCGKADVEVKTVRVGYSSSSESSYICSTATMIPSKNNFNYNSTITDTVASDSRIKAIKNHLLAMAGGWSYGTRSPVNPTASGGSDATYTNTTASLPQTTKYGEVNATGSTFTLPGTGAADPTCASPTTFSGGLTFKGANTLNFSSGCYVFGGPVIVNSSGSAAFNVVAGAKVVFVFKSSVTANSSSTLSFGNATVYMNGGSLYNNAGSATTFGNGSFYLWGGSMYNNSSSAKLTFGTGPFYFYGGTIYNNGSMTFGNGPYYFSGGSLTLNSGSTTVFGVGDIEFYGGTVSAGGTSVTFGQGGSTSSGSGTIWMYGGSFSLTTNAMTAIGETFAFYGGTQSLLGVGAINAIAPTSSSPTKGYRDILFAIWGGAFNLYQSSAPTDVMSGLIYAPSSNSSIYGSQTVTIPSDGCFQIMAGTVDIYQNAKLAASPCRGFSNSTTSTEVQLLQ